MTAQPGELVQSNHAYTACRRCGFRVHTVQRDGRGPAFFPPCDNCGEKDPNGPLVCPRCGELRSPGATQCDCGQRLTPRVDVDHVVANEIPPGCSCGGNDICTACVLASYERDS